jgi:hypothetical protein
MAAADNKTLRTKCASCGKDLTVDVDADPKQRTTWPLVGARNGTREVFPACTDCYRKGWRPEGYVDAPLFGES